MVTVSTCMPKRLSLIASMTSWVASAPEHTASATMTTGRLNRLLPSQRRAPDLRLRARYDEVNQFPQTASEHAVTRAKRTYGLSPAKRAARTAPVPEQDPSAEHQADRGPSCPTFGSFREFRSTIGIPPSQLSSIQAGTWSLGLSHPRSSTSTPALRNRSDTEGLTRRWSIRRPELRS